MAEPPRLRRRRSRRRPARRRRRAGPPRAAHARRRASARSLALVVGLGLVLLGYQEIALPACAAGLTGFFVAAVARGERGALVARLVGQRSAYQIPEVARAAERMASTRAPPRARARTHPPRPRRRGHRAGARRASTASPSASSPHADDLLGLAFLIASDGVKVHPASSPCSTACSARRRAARSTAARSPRRTCASRSSACAPRSTPEALPRPDRSGRTLAAAVPTWYNARAQPSRPRKGGPWLLSRRRRRDDDGARARGEGQAQEEPAAGGHAALHVCAMVGVDTLGQVSSFGAQTFFWIADPLRFLPAAVRVRDERARVHLRPGGRAVRVDEALLRAAHGQLRRRAVLDHEPALGRRHALLPRERGVLGVLHPPRRAQDQRSSATSRSPICCSSWRSSGSAS